MSDIIEHDTIQVDGQLELPLDLTDEQLAAVEQIAQRNEFRKALNTKLDELRAGNNAAYDKLLAQGVQPDPTGVVMLRLNTLINLVLDGDARTELDLRFEQSMAEVLDKAQEQAAAMKLAVPTGAQSETGLILPGQ